MSSIDKGTKQTPESLIANNETKYVTLFLIGFYILNTIWGLWSDSTWDDDCQTRYFYALNAIQDPREFFSTWNRPLWVVLFVLPVQLGKFMIPLVMNIIAVFTAYILYLSAKELKLRYAFLVIPFLLFQPFFFGVSRDALTEPLSACIIACGFLFMLRKKWLPFVIMGALLPLARLELSVLLLIWFFVLFKEKQLKYAPILTLGVILWIISGPLVIADYDLGWLFDQLYASGSKSNIYGRKPFTAYMHRYTYTLGPLISTFFLIGLFTRNWEKVIQFSNKQLFIFWQWASGVTLYTLFASSFDLGNSAGFLRNLIALSPFVALMALQGFLWFEDNIIGKKKHLYSLIVVVATVLFVSIFGDKLFFHHFISDQMDWYIVITISALALLLIIANYNRIKARALALIVIVGSVGYTLATEPPDAGMNIERVTIDKIANVYKKTVLSERKTYCNHAWFYWKNDKNPKDEQFGRIDKSTFKDIEEGAIVIWESHYANRLRDGFSEKEIKSEELGLVELLRFSSSEDGFKIILFVKQNNEEKINQLFNQLSAKYPDLPSLALSKGKYLQSLGKTDEAFQQFQKVLSRRKEADAYAHFVIGEFAMKLGNYQDAVELYKQAILNDPNYKEAYLVRGKLYSNRGNDAMAIKDFGKVLELDNKYAEAYLQRAYSYLKSEHTKKLACLDIQHAVELDYTPAREAAEKFCEK